MTEHPPVSGHDSGRTHRKHGKRIGARYALLLVAFALTAYVIDQLTKIWVVSTMVEGQVTAVLPPVLSWHFIRNSGAAFSIGTEITWVFTIIQALVSIAIITQIGKVATKGWAVALGLVLGGALGNLTDRLFREPAFGQGHVVDFIALPNFAIFNIADTAVVSGVILICLLTLRGIGLDGRRSNEVRDGVDAAEAADDERP
ncbi:signal peptidase II [Arthrobacter subterraneus]|uniref:Lipoprotein signal peptidase n=1 Tax=Arthrobacter subterraneus TaxID=335973 RepID=A0A1G8JK79_9MICC|nr:signal peptidase II [Arthrobacter subterraneus]SDI31605.1 signal peptidase II [Arthrobacter subterraneus]